MKIPPEVERKVVTRLYETASALDWDSLTPRQRSAQYAIWVNEDRVGGRLKEYLNDSDARVWIKDGPMKEWRRARSGVGKYADLIEDSAQVPVTLVCKALGEAWTLDESSIQTKPLRLVAYCGEEESVIAWGPPRDLKHLVWAALNASAEGDLRTWTLCIVETFTAPTPANERQAHVRIANRCNLKIKHIGI